MATSDFAAIGALIVSAGAAVLTFRSATAANKASAKKVDLEEHRDSMARLQAIINEQDKFQERLRTQIDRTNSQLDSMQQQLSREQDVSQVLRSQVTLLQEQVRTLQRMVNDSSPRRAAARIADADLPQVMD